MHNLARELRWKSFGAERAVPIAPGGAGRLWYATHEVMPMKSNAGLGFLAAVLLCGFGCGGQSASIESRPMPEGGNYTGVYFSPQYGEMHMIQNGKAVHGEYKKDERSGKIAGEVNGDVLSFEWTEYKAMISNRPTETRGRGYFRYIIDPSNGDHLLKGRWGIDDDDQNGGEWNAYKSKSREPQVGFASGGESGEDEFGDEGSDDFEDSDDGDEFGEEGDDDIF
jgi:hypothetical protein